MACISLNIGKKQLIFLINSKKSYCAIEENGYVILEELNAIKMTLRAFADQQDVFHFLEWF